MGLWKLRLSLVGTLAIIISLSTLFFTVILSLTGVFNYFTLVIFVVVFNLIQWLIAPYLIDGIYRVRQISKSDNPKLVEMVENLSRKSGMKTPKVMIAKIPLPNAFAYSSPVAGSRVAVTEGLLKTLDEEEVEAVVGHELGHLKHRDVQVMLFVSILPALFYYLGYSLLLSSRYSREEREGGTAVIGIASIALYWILTLFTLYISRLREYFADQHSVAIVEDGPRKLSEGLAKIVYSTKKMKKTYRNVGNLNAFKALFISDPDRADVDATSMTRIGSEYSSDQKLVEEVLRKEVTTADRIVELFSTHPNMVKRLRALKTYSHMVR